ncbi:MAG: hypothetical protein ACLTTH_12415 [Holdemanella porci]
MDLDETASKIALKEIPHLIFFDMKIGSLGSIHLSNSNQFLKKGGDGQNEQSNCQAEKQINF